MQRYEYGWDKTKPHHRTPQNEGRLYREWDENGWELVAVTTRPGILGGIFGTTATWTLFRRPRAPEKPSP